MARRGAGRISPRDPPGVLCRGDLCLISSAAPAGIRLAALGLRGIGEHSRLRRPEAVGHDLLVGPRGGTSSPAMLEGKVRRAAGRALPAQCAALEPLTAPLPDRVLVSPKLRSTMSLRSRPPRYLPHHSRVSNRTILSKVGAHGVLTDRLRAARADQRPRLPLSDEPATCLVPTAATLFCSAHFLATRAQRSSRPHDPCANRQNEATSRLAHLS